MKWFFFSSFPCEKKDGYIKRVLKMDRPVGRRVLKFDGPLGRGLWYRSFGAMSINAASGGIYTGAAGALPPQRQQYYITPL